MTFKMHLGFRHEKRFGDVGKQRQSRPEKMGGRALGIIKIFNWISTMMSTGLLNIAEKIKDQYIELILLLC